MAKIPTVQLDKQLSKLHNQVVESGQAAHMVFSHYRGKGIMEVVRGGCILNPSWVAKLGIEDIRDREKRRQANKLLRQLGEASKALWDEKIVADGLYDDLVKVLETISSAVHGSLDESLKKLESWVQGMTDRSKIIDYNLKELLKLVTSKAPARTRKRKERTRGKTMAKKESISDLLKQLAGTEDQDEKRLIRKKLRAQGHTGGLQKAAKKTAKKAKKKVAKKKVAKKKTKKAARRTAAE